ncbi:MAG: hypothetical protein NDI61_01585 [Bdellovibrionaceae bacterium]|nr:hypothetical protein [Pseudobdellovibrionaceae bacterium]
MKFLIWSHFAIGLIGSVIIGFWSGWVNASDFAAGAALSWLNLLSLVVTWPRILAKKLVALSIGVIVLKFAILGSIIYAVVAWKAFQIGWFSAGIATVVLSTVATGLLPQESPEKAER